MKRVSPFNDENKDRNVLKVSPFNLSLSKDEVLPNPQNTHKALPFGEIDPHLGSKKRKLHTSE